MQGEVAMMIEGVIIGGLSVVAVLMFVHALSMCISSAYFAAKFRYQVRFNNYIQKRATKERD